MKVGTSRSSGRACIIGRGKSSDGRCNKAWRAHRQTRNRCSGSNGHRFLAKPGGDHGDLHFVAQVLVDYGTEDYVGIFIG